MMDHDALLSAHFDDGPTAESSAALRRWLAENPEHVDQFVELSCQHFDLYDLLSQQKLSEGRVQGSVENSKLEIRNSNFRLRRTTAATSSSGSSFEFRVSSFATAAAAAVALAITAWFVFSPQPRTLNPEPSAAIALLTNAENAVFTDSATGSPLAPIKLGSELRPSTLKLESGSAQLMFRSGAVVDMTGPCEFEMTGVNRGRLHNGAIHTLVPAAASGFTVFGPGGIQVIDLGTEFEMRVDPPDAVLVKVLEGTVEVIDDPGQSGSARRILTAGRAARIQASTIHEIELTSVFTPQVLSCSTPIRAGAAPVVMPGGRHQTPEAAIVFAERAGVMIDRDLEVTFTEPGIYTNVNEQAETLAAPARVDSYMIHYDPNPATGGPMTHGKGTITFARPIVGIIATSDALRRTDARFGAEATDYAMSSGSRGGPRGIEDVDVITLSPDRRTIVFDFAAGHHSDQVRVLVQAADSNAP